MKNITVYTDGGVSMKNSVGGWAAILIFPDGEIKELSGAFDNRPTNNIMELWGPIAALDYIRNTENIDEVIVTIVCDSEYVTKGITLWINKWKRKNWKATTGPVKNKEYWMVLDTLRENMNVNFSWVKGHAGNEWNERADHLAVSAYKKLIKI